MNSGKGPVLAEVKIGLVKLLTLFTCASTFDVRVLYKEKCERREIFILSLNFSCFNVRCMATCTQC
jgi:hypothetical protein